MKYKALATALGLAAFAALTTVAASAHGDEDGYNSNYGWNGNSQHDRQHGRLDNRHDNIHDRLDNIHEDAHDQRLNPWEHRQLHNELDYRHAEADSRLQRDHWRKHQRNRWQRRSYYGGWNDNRGWGY
jgi:Spy/CpxP family protein refolding chaperone